MAKERLQKILAKAGKASRRGSETLIAEGRVRVDGKVIKEQGAKADPRRQRIEVDGEKIEAEPLLYVLFHKPRGVVSTMSDPEGRETVRDYMKDVVGRVVPVGRLDFHTSGVLLLTNDGEFAAALLHPKNSVPKTYVAKVRGVLDEAGVESWRQPIEIEGRQTAAAEVRKIRIEGDKTWLQITLREGKNRHIHRLGEATGNTVLRLARVSFAGIEHEGVRPGQWRYLSREELSGLKKTYGVPKRIWPAPPLPNREEIRKARTQQESSVKGVVDGKPRRVVTKKAVTKRTSARRIPSGGTKKR